jgi:uncharacterized protein (TIRG00374 family)
MLKKLGWTLIKVCLFAAAIFILLRHIPLNEVPAALQLFNPFVLFAVIFLQVMRYFLLGLRWRYACRVHNINLPVLWFLKNEFEILFLEFAFPLPDMEDVLRILMLKSKKIPLGTALSISLLMRLCGMGSMAVLLLGLLISRGKIFFRTANIDVVLLTVLPVLVITGIILHKYFLRIAAKLIHKIPGVGKRFGDLLFHLADIPISATQFFNLIIYSALHLASVAASLYFLIEATGYHISFVSIYLLVPVFMLSLLVPLSVQGFGLPEMAMAVVLPAYGLPKAIAAAIAAVHLAVFILLILTGAILVFINNERFKEFKQYLPWY